MSGGKQLYEKVIAEKRCKLIAMQVFAAGSVTPKEALEYVCNLKGIDSILLELHHVVISKIPKNSLIYLVKKIDNIYPQL